MSNSFRASDADRDQVTEVLHAAYAEGRLTIAEHSERTDAALDAKTLGDLLALTEDLVPTNGRQLAAVDAEQSLIVVTQGATDEADKITAVLATVKRVGPWRIRRRSTVNSLMGSVYLDLTQATFDADVVEVSATNVMAELTIRVPPGTVVRDEVANVLGESSVKGVGDPDSRMPTLVIRGTNIMGEVKVRGPKKPPPWRKALT